MQGNKKNSSGSAHGQVTGFSKHGNRTSASKKKKPFLDCLVFEQQSRALTTNSLVSQTRPCCLDSYTRFSQAHRLFANLKCGFRVFFNHHIYCFSANTELLRRQPTILYVLIYSFAFPEILSHFQIALCYRPTVWKNVVFLCFT
jgi:hypothetical protein